MDRADLALGIVVANVALNMGLDLFLISSFPFSLRLGLIGVAQGYLVSSIAYSVLALIASIRTVQLRRRAFSASDIATQSTQLFKVGGWTGIDSFVRNFFYFFVLQLLNFMGPNQFAGFQLFQKIMWTALIPVIAIAEGTSIRVGNYLKSDLAPKRIPMLLKTSASLAFAIIGGFGLLGLVGIDAMGFAFTSNPDVVYYSRIMFFWQIVPYILFAVAMNLRGLFFGTGKTYYILIISLVLNLLIILPFFVLINWTVLPQAYESVMLMFVFVDVIDIVITLFLVRHLTACLFRAKERQ
jgi:Na+-driven multidrug efflux pump